MDADRHAEIRRNQQLAALAEHAAGPIILDAEEALLQQLVGLARGTAQVSSDRLWSLVGGIAALRDLRHRLITAKRVSNG